MSGLMSICGPTDGPPHRLPIAISDIAAGLHLAVGILSAVEARHRTGAGQMVETSLLEAALSLGVYEAAHVFATGGRPSRLGQAHRGSSPYQAFQTADGWVTVGAGQQNFWERLCGLVEAPELKADPRFRTNADRVFHNDALVELLQQRLTRQPSQYWLDGMETAGIPGGPIFHCDEALADEHVVERAMVVETDHPVVGRLRTLGVPVKMSATPGAVRRPAPLLGEHTAEILAAVGMTAPTKATRNCQG